jgi:tetratricopeptide (TPR) repeat protein
MVGARPSFHPIRSVRERMRALLLAALVALQTAAAIAQSYPTATPVPRTTSVPALKAMAVQREVEERFTIGLDAEARGDWAAAAHEFERIVALNPPEPKGSTARYDLAIAYANMHRYDDAARQLRAAISLDPGFLAAMANLVAVDLARGDVREARRSADRYVALDPNSARALYSRGLIALQTGDAATARDDFGKLLHVNPSYAVAHYDLALAEERLGRYDAAERELRSALALAPGYARARFALGVVLLREGQHTAARNAFAQATADAASDPALATIAAAMRDSIKNP